MHVHAHMPCFHMPGRIYNTCSYSAWYQGEIRLKFFAPGFRYTWQSAEGIINFSPSISTKIFTMQYCKNPDQQDTLIELSPKYPNNTFSRNKFSSAIKLVIHLYRCIEYRGNRNWCILCQQKSFNYNCKFLFRNSNVPHFTSSIKEYMYS